YKFWRRWRVSTAPVGANQPDCRKLSDQSAAAPALWSRQIEEDEESSAAFDRAYKETTGKDWGDHPNFGEPGYDEWCAQSQEIHLRIDKLYPGNQCNERGELIAWNEIHDDLYPLCRQILREPARTIADLGLQAQAYALMYSEKWRNVEEY